MLDHYIYKYLTITMAVNSNIMLMDISRMDTISRIHIIVVLHIRRVDIIVVGCLCEECCTERGMHLINRSVKSARQLDTECTGMKVTMNHGTVCVLVTRAWVTLVFHQLQQGSITANDV